MIDMQVILNWIISGAGAVIAIIVLVGLIVIGFLLYRKHIGRYQQFRCIIWRIDGFGQLTQRYDDAGIFVDKDTQKKRLFLRKAKANLDPDNIPYIPAGKKPVIILLQSGLKNFKYIKPVITDEHINFSVGEEDVNWAITDYDKQKRRFDQNWLTQYLPFITLAFISLIILILFIYLFKQFGTIKELIMEIQELAKIMAAAQSGTTIT